MGKFTKFNCDEIFEVGFFSKFNSQKQKNILKVFLRKFP